MELAVLGATGRTGQLVVSQALEQGHHVIAVVRDPARLSVIHPALEVVTADVTDPDALVPIIRGRSAVLSALGAPTNKHAGIASRATSAALRALEDTGVARFIVVSAAPVGPAPLSEPLIRRVIVGRIVRAVFRDIYADLALMEEEIRATGTTKWTIVRPPRLLDKALTGRYRTVVGGSVPRASSISRADLAHAMLALVNNQASMRKVVGVAY